MFGLRSFQVWVEFDNFLGCQKFEVFDMLGLKVLVLGLLNSKECVCSSLGVVGTLRGIGTNIGSKLGLH